MNLRPAELEREGLLTASRERASSPTGETGDLEEGWGMGGGRALPDGSGAAADLCRHRLPAAAPRAFRIASTRGPGSLLPHRRDPSAGRTLGPYAGPPARMGARVARGGAAGGGARCQGAAES